jgi:DNA mismatch repair protein MutL
VLPEALATKIAAGEVVERPASIVKDLVENALDAGARRITVELEQGGVSLVRVSDDGEGMNAGDAALAFTRHATSKIRDEDDLARITTLGFRGEALPSIAAVAAVELTSREPGTDEAVCVRAAHGAVIDVRAAGAPEGTTVVVRDLFAVTPARRKFLKSTATELGQVAQLMVRLALAAPTVHLRLLHDGREVAAYPPVSSLGDRVRQVLGRERARDGRAFELDRLGIVARGFAVSPQLSFATARWIHCYVNGRAVRDRALTHAVAEAYASLVPRGRYPGAVVLLTMAPDDVDVNVHPAKHEVRFRIAHVVHDTVLAALRGALVADGGTRSRADGVADALAEYVATHPGGERLALGGAPGAWRGERLDRGGAPGAWRTPFARDASVPSGSGPLARATDPLPAAPSDERFSALRFVGQVFRGYIVCEGANRLVLIDQHAAHERVAFERLRAQSAAGAVERQALLLPVAVELAPGRAEAMAGAGERLAALGFEIEPFGERRFLVRAMPALLGDDDPQLLLEDLADGLEEVGSELAAAEALDTILGRIACHSVIRVGRGLGAPEVEALLAALDTLPHATNCPHGRPVSVEFTRGQVERMFGR